jgi:hypothetical protein
MLAGYYGTIPEITKSFNYEDKVIRNTVIPYEIKNFKSVHQLSIETGRYCNPGIAKERRFCYHCIEEDEHFLLECPLYKHIRKLEICP